MLLACTSCGKKYMWRSDPERAPSTCRKCGGSLKTEEAAPERPGEGRVRELEASEASLRQELAAAKASEAAAREALARQEGELAAAKAGQDRLRTLEASEAAARESLAKKESELEEVREAIEAVREQGRAALEKREKEFEVERGRLTDLIQGFDRVEAANTAAMDELKRELEAAHTAAEAADIIPELEEQIAGLRKQLSEAQETITKSGDVEKRLLETGSRIAALQEELATAVSRAEAAEKVPPGARVEAARELTGELNRSLEDIATSLGALKERVGRLSEALTAAESVPFPQEEPAAAEGPAAPEEAQAATVSQETGDASAPAAESRSWDDLVPSEAPAETEPEAGEGSGEGEVEAVEAPEEEAQPETPQEAAMTDDTPAAMPEVSEEVSFQEVTDPAEEPAEGDAQTPPEEKPGFFGKFFGKKK